MPTASTSFVSFVLSAARKPGALLAPAVLLAAAACTPGPAVTPPNVLPDDALCAASSDCAEGERCIGGVCAPSNVRSCESRDECPSDQVCLETGVCGEPTGACAGPDQCLDGFVCDGFTRTCVDPNAGACTTDSDCEGTQGCENGCSCAPGGMCTPNVVTTPDAGNTGGGTDAGNTGGGTDAGHTGGSIDLGGYVLENRESNHGQDYEFPAGVTVRPGQVIVLARYATTREFEEAWNTTLPNDVIYLTNDSDNAAPVVNGGESWALIAPSGGVADGETIEGSKNKSYRRVLLGSASDQDRWAEGGENDATPGHADVSGSGAGLIISEWSDKAGGGNYIYEFIEFVYLP